MKTIKIFLLAATVAAAVSCAKDGLPVENEKPTPEVELVPMTFQASHEPELKVAYDDKGNTVWNEDDNIMVISSSGVAREFEVTEILDNGKSAKFSGSQDPNADKFYAVYPSSAYKGIKEGKLLVELPSVQEAVAGTFHKSALLCIAKEENDIFTFTHSCAFLKFSIADPADIKSVHLTVNGSDNIAGIGYVDVDEFNMVPEYLDNDSDMSKYDMITLNAPEGGFQTGTDYFIAMLANTTCPDGISVFIEYNDNVRKRTTKSVVFPDGSRGMIRKLGQLDKNLIDPLPLELYNLGKDIDIAGKKINKNTHKNVTLISESNQIIDKDGVYFLSSGTETTLKAAYDHYRSLYIISNDSTKAVLNVNENTRWAQNGVIALKNIDIKNSTTVTMFQSQSSGGTLLLDACAIPTPNNAQFIYTGHTTSEIAICNCDIEITAAGKFLLSGKDYNITNCLIENNIVYSPEDSISTFKFIANTPTISTFSFNRNTIANVYASTTSNEPYNALGEVSTFNCNSNLFYLPGYSDSRYNYIIKIIPVQTLNESNNLLHKTNNTNNRMRVIYEGNPKVKDYWVTTKKFASEVIQESSLDLSKGIIIPSTSAGATR